MSRSINTTLNAVAAIAAAAATFLLVCVPMSTLWFAGVSVGA